MSFNWNILFDARFVGKAIDKKVGGFGLDLGSDSALSDFINAIWIRELSFG